MYTWMLLFNTILLLVWTPHISLLKQKLTYTSSVHYKLKILIGRGWSLKNNINKNCDCITVSHFFPFCFFFFHLFYIILVIYIWDPNFWNQNIKWMAPTKHQTQTARKESELVKLAFTVEKRRYNTLWINTRKLVADGRHIYYYRNRSSVMRQGLIVKHA